ncbi:MAG: thymidine phosphorylase, partial [Myxococcales bacterium]|nr:thymidine phosphorylase [Myxococcales bacterium]
GRKVDKHSTGGVGDKVSLCLAPLVCACGVAVPMISGRGLGHTGGTLDKLESIPGFNVNLDAERYVRQIESIGCALIGQTENIVPIDKRLYALRDVTATVESIPLIASSIMSKKLAEGIDALVLDVKVGNGAFMQTLDDAETLARTMVAIGEEMHRRVVAVLSDMSQPLGRAVGNAVEAAEAIDVLQGGGPEDLVEITLVLGSQMLVLGGVASSLAEGRAMLEKARHDGSALDKFRAIIEAQDGDARCLEDRALLPHARLHTVLEAAEDGVIGSFDTRAIGRASMILGAGRATVHDHIDPGVGFMVDAKIGDPVMRGQPLVEIYYNDPHKLDASVAILAEAISIQQEPPELPPLVHKVIA